MKLVYVFNREITAQKASVVATIHMCDAFASNGVNVEIALPFEKEKIDVSQKYLFERFGIKNRLNFSYYPKIMLFNRFGLLGSYFGIKKYLLNSNADIYFTRCPMIFTLLANSKVPVIYEAHNAEIHKAFKIIQPILDEQGYKSITNE
jgi:hypothetical protein